MMAINKLMEQRLRWTLVSALFFLLLGCMNKYEKGMIGYYEVGDYEILDSLNNKKVDLPKLKMNSDKTFALAFKADTVTVIQEPSLYFNKQKAK